MQNDRPKRKYVSPTFKGGHAYRWAYVERLRIYRAPEMALDHHGTPYVADPSGGPWTWDLRCQCGHQWTILESDFPGKLHLRSCGRPECPYSKPKPERRKHEAKSIRSIALDMTTILYVSQYVDKTGLSFSAACNELIRKALSIFENG
jgi:hypothetical protein